MELKKDNAISWRMELDRHLSGREYKIKENENIRVTHFFIVPVILRGNVKHLLELMDFNYSDNSVLAIYGHDDVYDIAVRLEKEDDKLSALGSEFILADTFIHEMNIDIAHIQKAVEAHNNTQSSSEAKG